MVTIARESDECMHIDGVETSIARGVGTTCIGITFWRIDWVF